MFGFVVRLVMIRNVSFGSLYSNLLKQNNNNQKQDLINRNYNEIYSHEQAHKSAGGALAGSIVIEKNADGIPVGGHVDIKMPTLDEENPQKTIDDANIVIRSAMAPGNPSPQDYRVAAKAREIKSKAQLMLTTRGRNLNLMG